ncbi:MAG: hypothetical protein JW862_14940 [Anaerolineales bacterium]|nr:hypothetical protein [Anaerolineales bacterium]
MSGLQTKLLNSIHLSVTGLQTLIDKLLESTVIAAGHFHIRRRRADLGPVVRTVVEEHGGRVGVESDPGSGAIFWFSISLEAQP